MGNFLQYALFPERNEAVALRAVDAVVKNPVFEIRPECCRFSESKKGTQVLLDGELEFAPLARALSQAIAGPVMLLYLYDGDCWGYDFCNGKEEDHFSTRPDYFGYIDEEERRHMAGQPEIWMKWFGVQAVDEVSRYLVHWLVLEDGEPAKVKFAYTGDQYPYGDGWQMTDFAAKLGFPWPFGEVEKVIPEEPVQPVLREILEKRLPPPKQEDNLEKTSLLWKLPNAFSFEYIRRLLEESGVADFGFEEKKPREIVEQVFFYCRSIIQPERDRLCQRLSVLAAFCAYWQSEGNAWGFLDRATFEPVCLKYEKPTDIYVLRARAALTEFSKRHRAERDLKRLMELDLENQELYQAEMRLWKEREEQWKQRTAAARRQKK